jgi:demethylmenaquinone methyltransferase / 2-methoxy-6-polyprenyl-1,4-benzoquinol methylase
MRNLRLGADEPGRLRSAVPVLDEKASSSEAPAKRREAVSGWTEADLINPHGHSEKAGKVRGMFAAIAGRYDLNNRVHSLWRDQAWRRYAVRTAAVAPGDTVVDVACGTGDLTEAFAARSPAGRVIGIDFTPEMLDVARTKLRRRPEAVGGKITYREGDAQALPLADASADVVSIAFGIRNVAEPARAIADFARVLKPGGRLIILEFDRPRFPPLRWFNDFYCGWLMPRTATLISGDRTGAYRYLPKSVGSFMSRDELCALLARSGFGEVSAHPLTMGICTCYRAVRR